MTVSVGHLGVRRVILGQGIFICIALIKLTRFLLVNSIYNLAERTLWLCWTKTSFVLTDNNITTYFLFFYVFFFSSFVKGIHMIPTRKFYMSIVTAATNKHAMF